jgi:hypothetical protein
VTHTTGPREAKVRKLAKDLQITAGASGATITEIEDALHAVTHWLLKTALAPWEDETCPACPKAMEKRGRAIKRGKA